jgi:hypothetical protein
MAHHLESFVSMEMRHIPAGSGEEVVQTDHVCPAADQAVAQVRSEKAGAACHQNARFPRHFMSSGIADHVGRHGMHSMHGWQLVSLPNRRWRIFRRTSDATERRRARVLMFSERCSNCSSHDSRTALQAGPAGFRAP